MATLAPKSSFASRKTGGFAAPMVTTRRTTTAAASISKGERIPTLGGAVAAPEPESRSCPVSQRLSSQDIIRMGKARAVDQVDPELMATLARYGLTADGSTSMAEAMEEFLKNQKTMASEKDSIFGQRTQAPEQANTGVLLPSDDAFRVKASDELNDIERHTKFVNRILNKLTPEKYDSLCNQLLDEPELFANQDFMAKTIELIYDRAINQPSFCQMYAKLSRALADTEVAMKKEDPASDKKKVSNYRRQLLQQVQKEYENFKKAMLVKADNVEKEMRKKRKLGNIHFVGELFKNGMLTDTIMHTIIQGQLAGDTPADRPVEEDLEVLCRLFNTTGKELDDRASKSGKTSTIDGFFDTLNGLAAFDGYCARIKFNIINTIDLRKNGWPVKTQQAKKIKDFEAEEKEREQSKLEGGKHSNYSGAKTAWGSAAEIHVALKTEIKPKEANKKKKDDDDGWNVSTKKGTKGAKQAPSKGPTKSAQTKVSAGAYGNLGNSSPKEQEKKKKKKKDEPKDKKEKKEKKDKKDKKEEDDEKKDKVPPPEFQKDVQIVVAARAVECMQESDPEKRGQFIADDFEKFKELAPEDTQAIVVREILHEIASKKDKDDRKVLVDWLAFVCAAKGDDTKGYIKRGEMVRGFGWFFCTAALVRENEILPLVYNRTIEAMQQLIPAKESYGEMTKSFQIAMKSLKTLFEAQGEDERLVDSVEELYEELVNEVWLKVNAGLEIDEEGVNTVLNFVLSLCHKNNFPYFPVFTETDEPRSIMCEMVEFLINEGAFTADHVAAWIEEVSKKKSSKVIGKVREHLSSLLGASGEEVAEDEEEEEEEANNEDEADE